MKLGELIQRVQSLYSKGVQSDNTRLSSRHIYSKLKSARATIISQKAKQKQKIGDWNYQTISCVEMIDVDAHECPCVPKANCVKIKRSKYPIPHIMSDYNGNLIDYIMTIDSGDKFDFATRSEILHLSGNRYTATQRRYIIDRGYIYIYGNNTPKVIQIRALFDDPIEAEQFISFCPDENFEKCSDIFDMDFPIDASTIDTVLQFAVQELITFFGQRPQENNTQEQQRAEQQEQA